MNQNSEAPLAAVAVSACLPVSNRWVSDKLTSWLSVAALAGAALWPVLAPAAVTVTTEQSRLIPQQTEGDYQGGYALDADNLAVSESSSASSVCPHSIAIRERNLGGSNQWGLRKAITPSSSNDCASFGKPVSSVALQGDTLVVGSPDERGQSSGNLSVGAVYVFRRNAGGSNNWGQVARLTPPEPPGELGSLRFGYNVAVSGNTVAAGVGTYPNASGNTVAVALFERNTTTDTFALSRSVSRAQVGTNGDLSYLAKPQGLAIDGNYLIVAITDASSSHHNSVAFLERNSGGSNVWGTVKQLTLSGSSAPSVAVSGSRVAVGESFNAGGSESRVHVYERGASTWTEVKTINGLSLGLGGGNAAQTYFGAQLRLSGDNLAVGNGQMLAPSGPIGGALLFQRNNGGTGNWGLVREFVAGDARVDLNSPMYLAGDTAAFVGATVPEGRVVELFSISAAPPKVVDWSDAPAPYPVATHVWGSGLRLGYLVDVESGIPAATGECQDLAFDDYRGLYFDDDSLLSQSCGSYPIATLSIGDTAGIDIRTQGGSGRLDAWLDKNRDQNWSGAGEKIADGAVVNSSDAETTTYTSVSLPLTLAEAVPGLSWLRIRFSSAGTPLPSGEAADGEVEDYPILLALPQFYAQCTSVSEGNSGNTNMPCTIGTQTINGKDRRLTHTVKVDYTTSACPESVFNPATSGQDFVPASGTVTLAPGSTRQTINIPIKGDLIEEPTEAVCLSLKNPVNASLSDSQPLIYGSILNDDQVTASLLYGGGSFPEAGGSASVCAGLSNTTDHQVNITVGFTGTATKFGDYGLNGNIIAIPAGSTSVCGLRISAIDDSVAEGDETVIATITSVQGAAIGTPASNIYTIKDDDKPIPSLSLSISAASINENAGKATVTATLSAASSSAVKVDLYYYGGAQRNIDYGGAVDSLTIPANATSASFTINAINDALDEDDESIGIQISSASGATYTTAAVGTTIKDDDATPSLRFATASSAVAENAGAEVTVGVQLSGASSRSVSATLAISGTATRNSDYKLTTTAISFAPGETSKSFIVTPVNDSAAESDETAVFTLSAPVNVSLGSPSAYTLTIVDDDLGVISLSPASASLDLREQQCLSAVASNRSGKPYVGAPIKFTRTGANPGTATVNSGSDGSARHCWTGSVAGTDSVKATSGAISSNVASIVWNKRASAMSASGYISAQAGGLPSLLTVSANLGDGKTGAAIVGARVRFSAGSIAVCEASSDAQGKASCTGTLSGSLSVILGLGYDANFDGDATYKPVAAKGKLVCVGALCL
ncbi:Calx-beta domain-containing protein [Hydrocarboniphaga sp.]|uniref:Calx-beta domain-containing protein n=1 Tax=Hydrocarboniphaga sp. TaxID=2033016 RepID=UPI003D12506E